MGNSASSREKEACFTQRSSIVASAVQNLTAQQDPLMFLLRQNCDTGRVLTTLVPHNVVPTVVTRYVVEPFVSFKRPSHAVARALSAVALDHARLPESRHGRMEANIRARALQEEFTGVETGAGVDVSVLDVPPPALASHCEALHFKAIRTPSQAAGLSDLPDIVSTVVTDFLHGPGTPTEMTHRALFRSVRFTAVKRFTDAPSDFSRCSAHEEDCLHSAASQAAPFRTDAHSHGLSYVSLFTPAVCGPPPFANLQRILFTRCTVWPHLIALACVPSDSVPPALEHVALGHVCFIAEYPMCVFARSPIGRHLTSLRCHADFPASDEDRIRFAHFLWGFTSQCPELSALEVARIRQSYLSRSVGKPDTQAESDERRAAECPVMDRMQADMLDAVRADTPAFTTDLPTAGTRMTFPCLRRVERRALWRDETFDGGAEISRAVVCCSTGGWLDEREEADHDANYDTTISFTDSDSD